jgi:predicted CoA-substrate-specific enzyme activase
VSEIVALGIDVGSTTVKMVGVNAGGDLVWHYLESADPRVEDQVDGFLQHLSKETGITGSVPLVATGYGRKLVHQAQKIVTEITCHAKGVFHQLNHGGTLIDIGGQDSKVIIIGEQGQVVDFTMNDKCAAGTGRFLENTAGRLRVPLDEMGSVALASQEEVAISSTCTVFAESEIVSLIAHGVKVEPILKGLHRSLIVRVVAMMRSIGFTPPLMLSGGVVKNPAIRKMIEEEAGEPVILPEHPQLMGAYGAALIALKITNG